MANRCVECDHLLVDDEVEYLLNGKSYCEDCCRMIRSAGDDESKNETISSKISEFGKGFKIPDDK
jgi:hypothetical protein